MKKYIALVALGIFVMAIAAGSGGCGGGGSSSGSTGGDTGPHPQPDSTILGRIVREGSSLGVPAMRVLFFDVSNNQVGQATTDANGWFDTNLPTTGVKFLIDSTTVPSGFQKQYFYNGHWYSATVPTCKTALPTIVAGHLTELPADPIQLRLNSSPPPPPPSGCAP